MVHEITSTIDWCEDNWVYHDNVAEWWNTLTAFSQLTIGIYGMGRIFHSGKRRAKDRHHWELFALYFSVFMVGIGTILFHATLTYPGQILDEVWMIVMMALVVHILCDGHHKLACAVMWILVAIASVVHAKYGFVSVFQFGYFGITLCTWLYSVHRIRTVSKFVSPAKRAAMEKLLLLTSLSAIAGATVWQCEEFFCPIYKQVVNPQLHAWWHLFSGWCLGGFGILIELLIVDEEATVIYWMGMPFYTLQATRRVSSNKTFDRMALLTTKGA